MAICYISWMLCSLFLMGPSKLKWAIFLYLTNGTKGVTQQLRSNFMRSNCKQRHQCHTLAKKGTLTLNMPFSKDSIIFKTKYNYLASFKEHLEEIVQIVYCPNAHQYLERSRDYRLRMIVGCKIRLTMRTRLTVEIWD